MRPGFHQSSVSQGKPVTWIRTQWQKKLAVVFHTPYRIYWISRIDFRENK